jgi:methionine-rich copper-binding protein CopC
MKILPLLSGPVLAMFAVAASAHAHLQKSSPADNSVINASPTQLVLNFSEAARLTALSIQKDKEPERKLQPPSTAAAQQISVPLPQLAPGTYSVSWHVLSDDGHVMSGTLHFTLAAEHAPDRPADHPVQH